MRRTPMSFRFGLAGLLLAVVSLTAAQGQDARDGEAARAAEGWAEGLVGSLLERRVAPGQKLALQPVHPDDFAGLNRRQRRQLHGRLLDALATASSNRQYELVDRESLADVSRALEDSPNPRWRESYLEVLKKAHARINIVCRGRPGANSLAVECRATDLHNSRSLGVSSAAFDLAWLRRPIDLNFAAGEIARGIVSQVGSSGRLAKLRIVDGETGKETGLSKRVADALEQSIDEYMRVERGAAGGATFSLEGKIEDAGARDGPLLLSVRLFSGDMRLRLFREYVARGSAGLAEMVGPAGSSPVAGCGADGEIVKRVVPKSGYTLGDWRLLAADRLERGDHAGLAVEAKAHLRDHCDWSGAREVLDLAVTGLASGIRLSGKGDARRALARIAEIEGSTGEHPVLLGLRARAHRLLGAYAEEEKTHRRWLRVAPDAHPGRRATLMAMLRARVVVADGKRFSAALGRPLSASAKEESAGWTDLHYAAVLNLPGAVLALVDAGAPADVRLKEDKSRFGDALRDTLVGLGHGQFKVYSRAGGQTPLMIAAFVNAGEAAATLVEAGADIRAKDRWHATSLHWAASGNALETAEWLVEQGAEINAKDKWRDTPLHWAASGNALETAEWLVGRGADIRAEDMFGQTPLHDAARKNALETAEWLVGQGADIHAKDNAGKTPLHEAAFANALKTAEWLVGQGADINAKSMEGKTPLSYAAWGNALEAAEWLAGRGANIRGKDNNDYTHLHDAAWGNARETAEWLVERGADIHAKDNGGTTPLHTAAFANARKTAEWLIERGADIHAKDNGGKTPLHWAARIGARKTAEWLIERGADINAKDNAGDTPLDEALTSTLGDAKERAGTAATLRRLDGRRGASLK